MSQTSQMIEAIKQRFKEGDTVVLRANGKYCHCRILSFLPKYLLVEILSSNTLMRVADEQIQGVGPYVPGKQKQPQRAKAPVANTVEKKPTAALSKKSAESPLPKPLQSTKVVPKNETATVKPKTTFNAKNVLPIMGAITKIEGTVIEIRPLEGVPFQVARDRVIDKVVIKEINQLSQDSLSNINIPIIWGSVDGEIVCVLGTSSAEQLNSRVNTLKDSGNYKAALAVALLLNSYVKVDMYHKSLELVKELYYGVQKVDDTKMNPFEAGVAKMKAGFYPEAIRFFMEAMANNTKVPDCIKHIVNCYTYNDQNPEAIKYVKDMKLKEFPEGFSQNSKNFNWLQNFYYQQGLYNDCLDLIKIKLQREDATDGQKSQWLTIAASCYLKLDEHDDAVKSLKDALEKNKDNKEAQNILADITGVSIPNSDALENLRLSAFSETYLTRMDKNIQLDHAPSEDYSAKLSKDLRSLGTKAYEDRAKVLLQIAKIEQVINNQKQDTKNKHRRYQSDHYVAHALYGFKKQILPEDSVRFFLCEGIALRANDSSAISRDKVRDNIALYLNLFNENKSYIFNNTRITTILASDLFKITDFYMTVSYLMQYKQPFMTLVHSFYESNYNVSAVEFLKSKGYELSSNPSKDEFVAAWKNYIQRNRTLIDNMNRQFTMMRSGSFEDLYRRFDEFKNDWHQYDDVMLETDKVRLSRFERLMEIVKPYFQSDDPGTKELRFKESKSEIESLIKEYTTAPTRFSYDCLVNVMEYLRDSINFDFEELIKVSTPKVRLELIGDCISNELDNTVSFQIQISNERGCFPIRNYSVEVLLSEEVIKHVDPSERNYNSIYGGSEQILQEHVELAKGVISKGAVQVDLRFTYQTHGKEGYSELHESLSLQFARQSKPIENRYKDCSEGSVPTKDMFFGRNEYISSTATSLMNSITPKQIIIYGQRRSGKTSILRFLKKELESRGAFCVELTLEALGVETGISGRSDIIFAYIMRKIAIAIRRSGTDRPRFKYSEDEYYTNPGKLYEEYSESYEVAEKFIDDMYELHKAFEQNEKWKGRKVVLLIDEFTRLYTMIENKEMPESIMRQWKAVTQDENVHVSVVMIGQDTTPIFKSRPYASNPFGVITDERISYLPEDGARELIVKPILDENGTSRYLNKAVDKIMEYTACSPYYLQIFCDKLVEYMNSKGIGRVTENDVDNVAQLLIKYKLQDNHFHNLYAATDPDEVTKNNVKELLRILAVGYEESKDKNGVTLQYIQSKSSDRTWTSQVDEMLKDLTIREVVIQTNGKYYIKVILFQLWLLQN